MKTQSTMWDEAKLAQAFAYMRRTRPELNGRLDRAEALLTAHWLHPEKQIIKLRTAGDDVLVLVHSNTKMNVWYTVDPEKGCNCRWAQHGGQECSHELAARAFTKALGIQSFWSKIREERLMRKARRTEWQEEV